MSRQQKQPKTSKDHRPILPIDESRQLRIPRISGQERGGKESSSSNRIKNTYQSDIPIDEKGARKNRKLLQQNQNIKIRNSQLQQQLKELKEKTILREKYRSTVISSLNNERNNLKSELEKITKIMNELERKNETLENENKEASKRQQELKKEVQMVKEEDENIKTRCKKLEKESEMVKEENQRLKKRCEKFEEDSRKQSNLKEEVKKKCEKLEEEIDGLKRDGKTKKYAEKLEGGREEEYKQKIKELEEELQKKREEAIKLRKQALGRGKTTDFEQLSHSQGSTAKDTEGNLQVKEYKKMINEQSVDLEMKKNQIKSLNQNLQEEKSKSIMLQKEIAALKINLSNKSSQDHLKPDLKRLSDEIDTYKSNSVLKDRKIKELELEKAQLKEAGEKQKLQLRQAERRNQELDRNKDKIMDENKHLNKQLNQQKEEIRDYKERLVEKFNSLSELKLDNLRHSLFAESDLVTVNSNEVKFILETIKKVIRKNVIKTKLIYIVDPKNPQNAHQYVDNKSHILFLLKTSRAKLLAGFIADQIKPQMIAQGPGFIANITDSLSFQLKPNPKARPFNYDPFHFLFGHSELKFKLPDEKRIVSSNFGVNGCFYDTKGMKVIDFLGQPRPGEIERECTFTDVEIYELKIV